MTGQARHEKSAEVEQIRKNVEYYADKRRNESGIGDGFFDQPKTLTRPSGTGEDKFVRKTGDAITGGIEFIPAVITLISDLAGGATQLINSNRIVIHGEGGVDDNLLAMIIPKFEQDMILYISNDAGFGNITILNDVTNPGGNFRLTGDIDMLLINGDIHAFMFDDFNNLWREITNRISGGAGGDNLGDHTMTQNLIGGGNSITGIAAITMTSSITGVTSITTSGNVSVGGNVTNLGALLFTRDFAISAGTTGIAVQATTDDMTIHVKTSSQILLGTGGAFNDFTVDVNGNALVKAGRILDFNDTAVSGTIFKLFGFKFNIACTDGIELASGDVDVTGGDFKVTSGDITLSAGDFKMLNGDMEIHNAVTDQSQITFRSGPGVGTTDKRIIGNVSSLEFQVDAGNDHIKSKIAGVEVFTVEDIGVLINDNSFVQPRTTSSNNIAFVPFRNATTMTTIGTFGTILIPETDTTGSDPSQDTLDGWFGNGRGNIGHVKRIDLGTGSGRHKLYINDTGDGWRQVELQFI